MRTQHAIFLEVLFNRLARDHSLSTTHVSLFTALYISWKKKDFKSPFSINRRELMSLSKIASTATYHKCIRELQQLGYIYYEPSYHPKLGSLVSWKMSN